MVITIVGAGISSISLALFLQKNKKIQKIIILEKEKEIGGLLRSYKYLGIPTDVGPHIIFSRHKEILSLLKKINLGKLNKLKRSNKILFKKKIFIKYPFENELSKLSNKDKNFCLKYFLNNKYSKIKPKNMYQFFLKTFGMGISNLYLNPYNKKIWKLHPRFLDTQMVERIPKPPPEDIINSADGIKTEGYKHQLYFYYPKQGGIQTVFNSFYKLLNKKKIQIIRSVNLKKISRKNSQLEVNSSKKNFYTDILINTSPLNEFFKYCDFFEKTQLKNFSKRLKYNSIKIFNVLIKGDIGGKNFAIMIPDKDVIFHRLSKLNFLGKNYQKKNFSAFQIEVTFKKGDKIDQMSKKDIYEKIYEGLKKINFIKKKNICKIISYKTYKYAYVIYNLGHRKNVDYLLNKYEKKIYLI